MYFHTLFIVAFAGISLYKQAHGDIIKKFSNPCSVSEISRRPRSASDLVGVVELLQPISQTIWLEFEAGYSQFCSQSSFIPIPTPRTKMEVKAQLRSYYSWLLWIKEARAFLDEHFGRGFLRLQGLDRMTNYVRQAVCAATINSVELPDFQDFSSLDPVDYLEPTCNILRNFPHFIPEALNLLRRNKRKSSWI